MVKQMMTKLPAQMDRRFAELEPAEMLDALTPKALCKIAEILDLPTDLDSLGGDKMMQHRRYRMQAEVAQSITATRIRVDDASLRHQEREDWLETLREKMQRAEAKLPKPRQEQNPKSRDCGTS